MIINSICICGAGTMGRGISLVCAKAGYFTLLFDLDPAALDAADESIRSILQKDLDKNRLSIAERDRILQQIHYTSDLQTCLADVFIEAIVEKTAVKTALFNQLAELNHSECIFATNTSSLSVNDIAKDTMHPARVIGMHFFNPANLMKLVEIVVTDHTDEQTKNTILQLATDLGKVPVLCKDSPGFIVNRVARPYYLQALRLAEQGIPMEQIDRVMESTGFRMGPFRLMDLIGNDINFAVTRSVWEQLGLPERLKPSPLQQVKVEAGELGKKTGKGYYNYDQASDVS